jgi:dolichyl-phosphate beta-glucosyltransferase
MSETILVVPVYNEARRLIADPWLQYLNADRSRALCFVDDGSTDNTVALLEELSRHAPDQVAIVRLPANVGKAEAVRQGMERALAEASRYAGFIDADLAAPLSEVALLHDELESHRDVWAAIGSRAKLLGRRIRRSERRHYFGRVFATCASIVLRLPVYDTQCGLKLFRVTAEVRNAFASPFRSKWIFDVELLARLADAAGDEAESRIREVPLEHWAEQGGSRLRLFDFVRAPLELLRIRRRPTL